MKKRLLSTCTKTQVADVSLNINNDLFIKTEPANQTVCEGSPASFTVGAIGSSLRYQWRKSIQNLINTGNISGSTSAMLKIDPVGITDIASDYNVIVYGKSIQSDKLISLKN